MTEFDLINMHWPADSIVIPTLSYLTTPQGRLGCRSWTGSTSKAALVQVHGIESHSGWFVEMGGLLHAEGFSVYSMDRLGSGFSDGVRGHVRSWRVWLEHLEVLIERGREENAGRPLYVLGFCWGAKVALNLALRKPRLIDGLILVAPALKVRVTLDAMSKLFLIGSLMLSPRRTFDIPIDREEMFTKEEPYLTRIRTDPLRLRKVTGRFLVEARKLDMFNTQHLNRLIVPTLAILAGRDEIVDTPAVEHMLSGIGASPVKIELLSNASHSIEFGPSRLELATGIVRWLTSSPTTAVFK